MPPSSKCSRWGAQVCECFYPFGYFNSSQIADDVPHQLELKSPSGASEDEWIQWIEERRTHTHTQRLYASWNDRHQIRFVVCPARLWLRWLRSSTSLWWFNSNCARFKTQRRLELGLEFGGGLWGWSGGDKTLDWELNWGISRVEQRDCILLSSNTVLKSFFCIIIQNIDQHTTW